MSERAILAVFMLVMMMLVPNQEASAQVYGNNRPYILTPQQALRGVGTAVRQGFNAVEVRQISAPDTVKVGQPVHFHAEINEGGATLPIRTRWEFGDGKTGSGICAGHSFDKPGTYKVVFWLRNHNSADTETRTITVVP